MRIIRPTDGLFAAQRRLAAAMLCLEHGALSHGPNLEPLPAPHMAWPAIPVRPVTTKGLATTHTYRPAVGIVFYTASQDFDVSKYIHAVNQILTKAASLDHLFAPRAVGASPCSIMRRSGDLAPKSVVLDRARGQFRKAQEDGDAELPARLLMWTPGSEMKLPLHYSVRAGFTWVFMPISAALEIEPIVSMANANAMMASILYDAGLMVKHQDSTDIWTLSEKDFDIPRLPDVFAGLPGLLSGVSGSPLAWVGMNALVVSASNEAPNETAGLTLLRNLNFLLVPPQHSRSPHSKLPRIPWDSNTVYKDENGAIGCAICSIPAWGEVILIRNPRMPNSSQLHGDWNLTWLAIGSPLTPQSEKWQVLCPGCVDTLASPSCLNEHLGAQVARTTIPWSQVEACALSSAFKPLGALLDGKVVGVPGVPGAFIVETRADGPAAGARVVVASKSLGKIPALTVPGIAGLRLPVISVAFIAEGRPPGSDWAP